MLAIVSALACPLPSMGLTTNSLKLETITNRHTVAGHYKVPLHDLGRRQGRSHPVTMEKHYDIVAVEVDGRREYCIQAGPFA